MSMISSGRLEVPGSFHSGKSRCQAVQVPVGGAASVPAVSGTPAQQSQQLQRKVADDIGKALEQGMRRNESEAAK